MEDFILVIKISAHCQAHQKAPIAPLLENNRRWFTFGTPHSAAGKLFKDLKSRLRPSFLLLGRRKMGDVP